jgi:hypothetical protein
VLEIVHCPLQRLDVEWVQIVGTYPGGGWVYPAGIH